MAVDTAGKRFSLMGFGAPVPQMDIIPDGTVAAADRADWIYLYSGIALSAPGGGRIMSSLVNAGGLVGPGGLAGEGGGLAA